jgi:hypothetical protein
MCINWSIRERTLVYHSWAQFIGASGMKMEFPLFLAVRMENQMFTRNSDTIPPIIKWTMLFRCGLPSYSLCGHHFNRRMNYWKRNELVNQRMKLYTSCRSAASLSHRHISILTRVLRNISSCSGVIRGVSTGEDIRAFPPVRPHRVGW